jgi:hypothetical protein
MSLILLSRDAFVTVISVSIAVSAIAAGMPTTKKFKDTLPTELVIVNHKDKK